MRESIFIVTLFFTLTISGNAMTNTLANPSNHTLEELNIKSSYTLQQNADTSKVDNAFGIKSVEITTDQNSYSVTITGPIGHDDSPIKVTINAPAKNSENALETAFDEFQKLKKLNDE